MGCATVQFHLACALEATWWKYIEIQVRRPWSKLTECSGSGLRKIILPSSQLCLHVQCTWKTFPL